MKQIITLLCISVIPILLSAQPLKPGFEKEEYRELLHLAARSTESAEIAAKIPQPSTFSLKYKSPSMGMDNLWELWLSEGNVAVICTRGSTPKAESWLLNVYSAMVPAKGELYYSAQDTFHYDLSADPRAAVHVGYLFGAGFLLRDIQPKLDSCYAAGIRDFLIMGHSQGGGISYLLTAYLRMQQRNGDLPQDIRFKTYCSAAPKPGNLYFAYSYEQMTQGGWAYNVVNASDWVPQVPFSVQTISDLNEVSPVPLVQQMVDEQSFLKRIVLKRLWRKLASPSWETSERYRKVLGKGMEERILKYHADFIPPKYVQSNNYVRTGAHIVLYGDDAYYEQFPNDPANIGVHHSLLPYLYLLERLE